MSGSTRSSTDAAATRPSAVGAGVHRRSLCPAGSGLWHRLHAGPPFVEDHGHPPRRRRLHARRPAARPHQVTARRSHSKRRPPASSCRRSASMSLIRPTKAATAGPASHPRAETGLANGPVADLSREGPPPGRLPVPGLSHGRVRLPPGRRTEGGRMPGIHRPGRPTAGPEATAAPMRFARGGGPRTWP